MNSGGLRAQSVNEFVYCMGTFTISCVHSYTRKCVAKTAYFIWKLVQKNTSEVIRAKALKGARSVIEAIQIIL